MGVPDVQDASDSFSQSPPSFDLSFVWSWFMMVVWYNAKMVVFTFYINQSNWKYIIKISGTQNMEITLASQEPQSLSLGLLKNSKYKSKTVNPLIL